MVSKHKKMMSRELLTAYDLIWESRPNRRSFILGVVWQDNWGTDELVIQYAELSEAKIPLNTKEVFGIEKDHIQLKDFITDSYFTYRYGKHDTIHKIVDKELKTWWVRDQLFKVVTIEDYAGWKTRHRDNAINSVIKND